MQSFLCSAFILPLLAGLMESLIGNSQVPVALEQRHKNIFENRYVRILEVEIPPGDTTLFHRHAQSSAIVFLSSTTTGSQILGEQPVIGHSKKGDIIFAPFGERHIIHRVWNQDSSIYHVMDIELFSDTRASEFNPGKKPGMQLVWSQNMARAYRFQIPNQQKSRKMSLTGPLLLICITGNIYPISPKDGQQEPLSIEAGKFIWIEPSKKISVLNERKDSASCVVLEFTVPHPVASP